MTSNLPTSLPLKRSCLSTSDGIVNRLTENDIDNKQLSSRDSHFSTRINCIGCSITISKCSKKSVIVMFALSILSFGIFPLTIGIGWCLAKAISWISKTNSTTDKKTETVAQDHFESHSSMDDGKPIRYKKEAKGAPHIVPKNKKKKLGRGTSSTVYEHRNNPNQAIKIISSADEYEIGAKLNHPVLAKSHQLFIKEYPYAPVKYKLVMEKVEGKQLTKFQLSDDIIPNKLAVKLIEQAKEVCIYLFQSGVYWKDVNDGNILIENNTENLRIIDFGFWRNEADAEVRVKHLLLGAMELTGWIVRNSSCVKENGEKDRTKIKSIAFPIEFFNEQIKNNQIISAYNQYFDTSWMENISTRLKKMNENQMIEFIAEYFDSVIKKLNNSDNS